MNDGFLLGVCAVLLVLLLAALAWGWRQRRALDAERTYWQQQRAQQPQPTLPPLFVATATALDEGLVLLDRQQHIRFANAAFQVLIAPATAREGQSLITVLRDYQADAVVRAALERNEPQTATIQPVLSPRTLQIVCHPLPSDDDGALVLLRDVTQIALLERARRDMVANVGHELRTPIATIKLLVETLQSEPPPPIAQRMLGQLDDELTSMTHLVDELRELSQIESGRLAMRMQPADVQAVVEHAVERLSPQAERRELQLATEIEPDLPHVLIDDERIEQVVLNLLNNALKFTPAGGTITALARCAGRGNNVSAREMEELGKMNGQQAVLVAVSDTGIGIPQLEQERVFERFYKVDRARTRNRGGTGLGLAIAKHVVERHAGRIWAESEEGRGSTFSFLLPLA
jgi:two-component system phosphate regulon sensor histidine kinase PhoR